MNIIRTEVMMTLAINISEYWLSHDGDTTQWNLSKADTVGLKIDVCLIKMFTLR